MSKRTRPAGLAARAMAGFALSLIVGAGCGTADKGVTPSTFDPDAGPSAPAGGQVPGEGNPPSNPGPDPIFEPPAEDGSAPPAPTGPVDVDDPRNATKDSDCDGLTDQEEFSTIYPGGKRTDPANPDTDGDGLSDGLELGRTTSVVATCAFFADVQPDSRTSPVEKDTDVDGLADGVEDANKNGRFDAGETDATQPDTDGDGLRDGAEDKSADGKRDPGETDPRARDTDQDGISDYLEVTLTKTDPTNPDTDADGCVDGLEDINRDGVKQTGETDPKIKDCGPTSIVDTDGDGLPDKVEDINGNGQVDAGETDPKKGDTDGDGLSDGIEDRNKNRVVDPGETDPLRVDSDCDGLTDGAEDANKNGQVDAGETDPLKADSDGDGVRDGVERGVTQNPDPSSCPVFVPDADPSTTTDPTRTDSDGDGVSDGAEDKNQDGKVDGGELDPKNGADVPPTSPAGRVCPEMQLKVVRFDLAREPDLKIALPTSFTTTEVKLGKEVRGLVGYDDRTKVGFLAYRFTQNVGATALDIEAALRPRLSARGSLSNTVTQSFTTWDGYPAALGFYDQAAGSDLKTRLNDLANDLVGAGAGVLGGGAGVQGPFKLQAEVVRRSAQSGVVVLAITPGTAGAPITEPSIFAVRDTAGGSALAQFGDPTAAQCERFTAGSAKVDFLFVVDNSGSMGSSQQALKDTANAFASALSNAALDWRVAVATTDRRVSRAANAFRPFTTNIDTFKSWLDSTGNNSPPWVGTSGNGTEAILQAACGTMTSITPAAPNEANKLRTGAQLVIVLLGDADDQSYLDGVTEANVGTRYARLFTTPGDTLTANVEQYTTYTDRCANNTGQAVKVHGIICPVGARCPDSNEAERQFNPQRHRTVINATGGLAGSITDAQSIRSTMDLIIQDAIFAAGHRLEKPPIGASVKVALDAVRDTAACNKDDLPRSRVSGFDFDAVNRTVALFGACRPPVGQTVPAAVSYRYWVDATPAPNGTPPPCVNDPYFDPNDPDYCRGILRCNTQTNVCECPPNCGGTVPPGQTCNMDPAVCATTCTADCGGACGPFHQCNPTTCACQCVENATCGTGYKFDTSACGCVCDTAALACPDGYAANANTCACECKADCGGCGPGLRCNRSRCSCESGGIN